MIEMNFNSRHIHYQNDLPLFMLKHIAKCIEKKFNISDANEHINEIFKKYKRQYEKKQNYDKEYFTNSKSLKQRYNVLIKEYSVLLNKMINYMSLFIINIVESYNIQK